MKRAHDRLAESYIQAGLDSESDAESDAEMDAESEGSHETHETHETQRDDDVPDDDPTDPDDPTEKAKRGEWEEGDELPQYVYRVSENQTSKKKYRLKANRGGKHRIIEHDDDPNVLYRKLQAWHADLDKWGVPPTRKQAPRKRAEKQSDVDGVRWHPQRRKWEGKVYDRIERAKTGKQVEKFAKWEDENGKSGMQFDDQTTCEEATKKLRIDMDAQFETWIVEQVAADPLVRDLPRAPENKDEWKKGVVYWVANKKDGWKPIRMSKFGNTCERACNVCNQKALGDGKGGKAMHCIIHGGAPRCESGAHEHDDVVPYAKYVVSNMAIVKGSDGKSHPRPDLAGKRFCMKCMQYFDPYNEAVVKISVHKEDMVLSGVVDELIRRGLRHLVKDAEGILTNDCPEGKSRRRKDLKVDTNPGLMFMVENDENQHRNRTTSCERKKLAGHLVDAGTTGFTHEDDKLWDASLPTDEQLDAMLETAEDTPAMQRLRRARRAANQRLVRELNAKIRAANTVVAPKLHCLRFNCDGFVAKDGTKVGSLFQITEKYEKGETLKLETTPLFKDAIVKLTDRVLEIIELSKNEEWMEKHKEWHVEYMRYDGCDVDGIDRDGSVEAAQSSKKVEKEDE